jgi:hypothetical protein
MAKHKKLGGKGHKLHVAGAHLGAHMKKKAGKGRGRKRQVRKSV